MEALSQFRRRAVSRERVPCRCDMSVTPQMGIALEDTFVHKQQDDGR